MLCHFVTDLHGHIDRYEKLYEFVKSKKPKALFLGGDLLPHGLGYGHEYENCDFVREYLIENFRKLQDKLGAEYPEVFLILGNDDGRIEERAFQEADQTGLWHYIHGKRMLFGGYTVIGYAYVPPTPFQLKDWEKYDVSRYVDPGCISPEAGYRAVQISEYDQKYSTIAKDLEILAGGENLSGALLLFHTPPHNTLLDKADLDGRVIDHAPVDPHVGSIAVRRFIEKKQPLISMHGHVHESTRMTGAWRDRLGKTFCFNAAHDGPELAVVEFDPGQPDKATRILL